MQIRTFSQQHPILFNAVLIFITAIILITLCFLAMNIFTQHGKSQAVPDLKGKPLREAISILESEGLKWEINDSTYNDSFQPGCVVEQSPKALSEVKSHRTIYLTVTPFSPRLITMPNVKDMSERTGRSMLEGLGFRNIDIEMVPSEFNGLILGVSVNGKTVSSGDKVTLSSRITLQVGNGEAPSDSLKTEDVNIINDGGETLTDPSLI